MALRDQPYLPLYVQDFLTDEKLSECSAESTGVYIRLMCLMHKSEDYGTILLKQKDKQNGKQISDFAIKLARQMPYDTNTIERALSELLDEKVIGIEGDILFQKRMVRDGKLSDKRASAGSKGGKKKANQDFATHFANGVATEFAIAKTVANTENENDIDNEDISVDKDLVEEVETNPRARGKERKEEIKAIWDSYDFSPALGEKVKEWGQYKKERGDSYKPRGLKALLTQVQNSAARYGDDAVISVITQSMASGYEGITWDKLSRLPDIRGAPQKKSFSEIIAERNGGGS